MAVTSFGVCVVGACGFWRYRMPPDFCTWKRLLWVSLLMFIGVISDVKSIHTSYSPFQKNRYFSCSN